MNGRAKQRISYVLPLGSSEAGHRLGVNGLDVDGDRGLLYTAGRDGAILCWEIPWQAGSRLENDQTPKLKAQSQAHMHWINDITLVQSNSAVVSASSDLSVKIWRPEGFEAPNPVTIGLHNDYVKCLAKPLYNADWVASGGLDRKIRLLDLVGGKEKLQIDVGNGGENVKGSVYSLAAGDGLIASGGPDCMVRLWDPRSGTEVGKLAGHTDNVRSILLSHGGDLIMSAASDNTIKVWSASSRQCLSTLGIHSDSVWSLHSDHPELKVFYSSDRSGLVAKTDWRDAAEVEEGLSVAICQEPNGVSQVMSAGGSIWTATASSSINEWRDVNLQPKIQSPGDRRAAAGQLQPADRAVQTGVRRTEQVNGRSHFIPPESVLSMTGAASHSNIPAEKHHRESDHPTKRSRKPSLPVKEMDTHPIPMQQVPGHTIPGQDGLTQSRLLSDRRRALTVDTAGLIVLWDLIRCRAIRSFGKRPIDDVLAEIDCKNSVVNWCLIDVRSGNLACTLDEAYCFDGEVYADELEPPRGFTCREDQRINLGKWLLRSLFDSLIIVEQELDSSFRGLFRSDDSPPKLRPSAPPSIPIPLATPMSVFQGGLITPGLGITAATPSVTTSPSQTVRRSDERSRQGSNRVLESQTTPGINRSPGGFRDYFSSRSSVLEDSAATPSAHSEYDTARTLNENPEKAGAETEKEVSSKKGGFKFGEKIRLSLGSKKGGRSPVISSREPETDEQIAQRPMLPEPAYLRQEPIQPSFLGVVQVVRNTYRQQFKAEGIVPETSLLTPLPSEEVPLVRVPQNTILLIQEDRPEMGGTVDLYRGTVGSLVDDRESIESVAPFWLGEAILLAKHPAKDLVKLSFLLKPYQNLLPDITTGLDGRLNANRLLRTRKILGYADERLREDLYAESKKQDPPTAITPRPDEVLELYCQDKLVPVTTTLLALRTHWWKAAGDIQLCYKSTGRVTFAGERTLEQVAADEELAQKAQSNVQTPKAG